MLIPDSLLFGTLEYLDRRGILCVNEKKLKYAIAMRAAVINTIIII